MLRWRRLCIAAAEQSVADEDAAGSWKTPALVNVKLTRQRTTMPPPPPYASESKPSALSLAASCVGRMHPFRFRSHNGVPGRAASSPRAPRRGKQRLPLMGWFVVSRCG